jgi:RNA polymerase sigma-70 factor (ECF subfamily)
MSTPPHDVSQLVEHLFRRDAGRMIATLTRIFGPGHVELAEDVVQEALIEALRRWPMAGVPEHPSAWLIQVAKRRALDVVRRERAFQQRAGAVRRAIEEDPALASDPSAGDLLDDDQLRMIFLCCHPRVPLEGRVALTLKLVGGFGASEIARAFLAEESAIFQRLVRAKRRLRDSASVLEIPEGAALASRLDAVLEVLYLLFNEGHTATTGDELLRRDLCAEAIRLTSLLASHRSTDEPRVHALLALFLLQASRLDARTDAHGDVVLLAEQDRSRWNRPLIERGLSHLDRSAVGDVLTTYHLEAEIAACHATAARWEDTDWARIVAAYDALYRRHPSPLVALNRAVAVAELEGANAGLDALDAVASEPSLARYHLLHSTRAELMRRVGRLEEARRELEAAMALAPTEPARRFLARRLGEVATRAGSVESVEAGPSRE